MADELLTAEIEDIEIPGAEEQPEGEQPVVDGEQPTGEQPEGEKTPVTSLFQADGKKLDPQVSAALTKIKTEHPELGKLLSKAVYRVAEMDREFPGGLTEVRELRDKVEELGGLPGIEEKLSGLEELDGLAKQFMSADPAFVEDMATSSPESFAALAPVVFQKFAEVSPDGFGAYIGRVVYGDMQQNGLPLMLMRLGDLLGDNAKAQEALAAVNTYLGGFKALAEKPAPAVRPRAATAKPDDSTAKREEALRAREWQGERETVQKEIVNAEYMRSLAGRKPDTEEKAQIKELFLVRSKAAADRLFPGWSDKAQRYITNNDKAGYLRYMKSIYARVVPEAIASAVNSTLRGKKAAPAAQPKPKAAAAGAGAAKPADSTYKPVSAEPSTWDIDYDRTVPQMLRENRAILKDGRKVSWK